MDLVISRVVVASLRDLLRNEDGLIGEWIGLGDITEERPTSALALRHALW